MPCTARAFSLRITAGVTEARARTSVLRWSNWRIAFAASSALAELSGGSSPPQPVTATREV